MEHTRLKIAAAAFLLGTFGFPAMAQVISEIPRSDTLIFENIEGRVPVPDNMNPYLIGSNLDWGMWQATQESLFYLNLETGELEPWLAESGNYSGDFKTVTIKLRDGVKWGDGVAFTAEDVAFTINMLKANAGLQYSSDFNKWVDATEVVDPLTVIFHLKEPNPRFLVDYFGVRIWRTALIAPRHVWQGKDPKTFTNFDLEKGWPLGTGPYKLVRSTETETVFDRRESWWAAETGFHTMPQPRRVIWTGIGTEDARAAMAVNNQLDAAWVMSLSTYKIAKERNANVIAWTEDLPFAYLDACPRHIGINTKLAPFDKKEIRQALKNAVDRQQIIDIAYEGMTEPSYTTMPLYAPLKAFLERHGDVIEGMKSKQEEIAPLMIQAGLTQDADGFWIDARGTRVRGDIIVRSGETLELKTASVVAAQLRRAGFDVSARPMESAIFYSDISTGSAPLWIGSACGSVSDPYASFEYFTSARSAPIGQAAPTDTTTRFENATFDAAVATMSVLPFEDPAFEQAAREALSILVEEMPVVPLVQARLLTPFVQTYWTNWPTAQNNYIHPGHWWVTGNRLILEVKKAQ